MDQNLKYGIFLCLLLAQSCYSQDPCVSNSDCSQSGQLCYTVTCSTSSPSGFQECLTVSAIGTGIIPDDCTANEVSQSVTTCESNSDCGGSGQCCLVQICQNKDEELETEFVCSAQSNENINSLSTTGCSYGECLPQDNTYDPLQYPCSSTSDCLDISLANNVYYCCANLMCGDQDGSTYCVDSATTGLEQANQFSDLTCVAQCVAPLDAVCTPVPFDKEGAVTGCAVYGENYCCMVQIVSGQDQYNSGQQGRCNSVESVDSMDDSDQYTYICGAVTTVVSLALGLLGIAL